MPSRSTYTFSVRMGGSPSFGASTITQRLSLGEDGRVLVIDNDIDWHEDEKFLKLAFPVDVFADEVVAETQFGYQRRAHHTNTSWEAARFETHTQRWFLVEEPGFGVAFLNDSSHGFDVTREHTDQGIVQHARFSLLRAPKFPDPRADRGRHSIRLGVLVGADIPAATEAGWAFQVPARAGAGEAVAPLAQSNNDAVIISAVKLADDQSGDVIVRLYESRGARAQASIALDVPGLSEVVGCDLIERVSDAAPLDVVDGAVVVSLRAFEVTTLRVRRAA